MNRNGRKVDECGKHTLIQTGNWGLKSANNHWMWMCPLKRSFGCQPDASTNGLILWRRTRNANLLSAAQLRVSMAALLFVCVSAAIIFLWKMENGRGRGGVLPSNVRSHPVMNRLHIFMFLPENTWITRGVKVKSGKVFGPFSTFPPLQWPVGQVRGWFFTIIRWPEENSVALTSPN